MPGARDFTDRAMHALEIMMRLSSVAPGASVAIDAAIFGVVNASLLPPSDDRLADGSYEEDRLR